MAKLTELSSEMDLVRNRRRIDDSWSPAEEAILGADGHRRAWTEITGWPGYEPTPLHRLPGLAEAAGVEALLVKDEGDRFGLGSFKALGGAYGVFRMVARRIAEETGEEPPGRDELTGGRYRDRVADVTVTCATDGNHGRAVAWGAELVGCECVVFVPGHVTGPRVRAIEGHGARVVRVEGSYDDAVARADAEAREHGRMVISDTAYPGYEEVPRTVMQGYTVMAREAAEQWGGDEPPTHVFLQAGVGGLAAAVAGHFRRTLGSRAPAVVLVEPREADGLFRSLKAGEPRAAGGSLDTLMGGLSCREVSTAAWPILLRRARAALRIPDGAAPETMTILARGAGADPEVVAGESGAAGMAGFLLAALRDELREALGLDEDSRVLAFVTEGATDPGRWGELTGVGSVPS